ncbi:MAG: hypothetical protein LUD16_07020 [Lachnospiraceae bacterium]|nr:hypothetical protein [Lachnospiraceae bacterium]
MSTASTIQINFNNAKKQASELETIAGELKQLANNDLEDTLNSVAQYWESDNATAYIKKGNTVQQDILDISTQLTKTATSIRKIAKITYDAEMAALNLALQRRNS